MPKFTSEELAISYMTQINSSLSVKEFFQKLLEVENEFSELIKEQTKLEGKKRIENMKKLVK